MKTKLPFKGARLMGENEVPAKGDFAKWSDSARDAWVEVDPRFIGLPVATIRERAGQDTLQFATSRAK